MSAAPDLNDIIIDGLRPPDAPDEWAIEDWRDDVEDIKPWSPNTPDAADWVARKAQRAQSHIASLEAQYDRLVNQAEAWLAHERKRHDATIAWAESMLRVWLEAEIAADDSKKPRKSRTLPSGVTVKRTAGGKSLVVEDEEALVEWLWKEQPGTVEFVAKYSKADVKRLLTGDGVAVPGVSIEQSPDGFKVELGGSA